MRVWEKACGAAAALALAVGAVAAHARPLDGLTGAEMSATVEVLKTDGKITDAARFPLIELKEPEKSVVLAWRPGQPQPRVVTVNVKEGGKGFKGEVDLAARTVLSWAPADAETMILLEEFLGAMDVALGSPEMQAGLKKRGLTREQVLCIPLTAGAFGRPDEAGKRLMKVPCLVAPQGSNFYAKPIEGLFAVIDLNAGQVLEVVDTGVRPVPADEWGYTQAEIEARADGVRPLLNPAALSQPSGANYQLDGGQVTWDLWRFRLRVDKRPGVVLSQVEATDQGRWRSVLYQAHLSEVFVPYMDPDEGWYWRTYMDSGEYGFGIFLTPLRRGFLTPLRRGFLSLHPCAAASTARTTPPSCRCPCRRTAASRSTSPMRSASSSAASGTRPGATTRSSRRPRTSPCPPRADPGRSWWSVPRPRSGTTTI